MRPRLLSLYFWKDLMYYYIHAKFHNQGLTGSGFMAGGGFGRKTI